ncbi:MAG: Amuc_1100 family pilus-like protein [Verrucomicrobiales bacterium]
MDSLKQNKFLSTYLAVVVLGALGLGFLLYSSLKANKAAAEAHQSERNAVTALQQKPLFPSQENLKKRQEQVQGLGASVNELQLALRAAQPALDTEASSDKFQSALTDTLSALKNQAELTKLNSRAGPDFDLGFGKYLANLPPRQAVPDLLFQLGALDAIVRTMLTDRVASIDDIVRSELDVESARPDAAADAKTPAGRAAAKKPAAAGPAPALAEELVLKRYPMQVRFTGSPRSVQEVLNHLAASKDYFYAIRSLRIENERKAGPPKGTLGETSEESKKDSDVVLGGEKVSVWLAVDLIRFLEPTAAATSEAKTASTN